MDIAFLAIKVILLTAACSAGPGLLIVGWLRLRCSPLEKLCGGFAASFIVVYLAAFLLFVTNAPTWAYFAASIAFAVMGAAGWRAGQALLRHRTCRWSLGGLLMILAWNLLHLAVVRRYGGGNWAVDWCEHFERTQYFLHLLPDNYQFAGGYWLPARPPLMNLSAAFFCRQVGLSFESYSLVFTLLNTWAFLPCCLLAQTLSPRTRGAALILAALFMLNPSINENATLTVTKAMAAGWVVLGVSFYLRRRLVAAALSLAAGILTHYSAAPYAAAIALHVAWGVLRGRKSFSDAIKAASAAAVLMATWFVWSIHIYGPRITFFSNSTATGVASDTPAGNLHRIAFNLFTTIVPLPFPLGTAGQSDPLENWGDVCDRYFNMTQQTLPMMAGLVGGVVAVWLVIRFLRSGEPGSKRFWLFFILFTFVIGVASNPELNSNGNAQVTLQSLCMMSLALLAAKWPSLPKPARHCVILGAAIDYALGIHLLFDRQSRIFATAIDSRGQLTIAYDATLGRHGMANYLSKLEYHLTFWADHWPEAIPYLQLVSAIGACGAIWILSRMLAKKNKPL